jgi:hypothetical protein
VLIFRTLPAQVALLVDIFDDQGQLGNLDYGRWPSLWRQSQPNASGYATVYRWRGPHAGPDGIAHLTLGVAGYEMPLYPTPARLNAESWDFSFDLKVQPVRALPLKPTLTSVGTWTFTVEAFELTPSVIYFQAVIDGASGLDIDLQPIKVAGNMPSSGSHFDSLPGVRSTRMNLYWPRPAFAAPDYVLQVAWRDMADLSRHVPNEFYTAHFSIPPPPQS